MTTELAPPPEPDAPSAEGRTRRLVVAAIVALVVVLGVKLVFAYWWRHGGPRRAIAGLAEDGAVKLADAVLDEVFGPAA